MFLPLETSHSVGAFFSGLTMLRWGVRPHMGQSSARAIAGRQSAKPQAADRRALRFRRRLGVGRWVLLRIGVSLVLVVGDDQVVVIDEALERGDQRVAEQARGAVGVGQ